MRKALSYGSVFFIVIIFFSCNKFREEKVELLYGEWEHVYTRELLPAPNNDVPPDWIGGNNSIIRLGQNGEFYSNGMEDSTGAFVLDSDKIIIKLGNHEDVFIIKKISGNKLTLTNEVVTPVTGWERTDVYQYSKK